MTLSEKQEQGLKILLDRYNKGEQYSVLSGYAGAGKSTLIKFIVQALGFTDDKVGYATPTGKAAQVLNNLGHSQATTIHRLLYDWRPQANGKFYRIRKMVLPKLVIVDEVSMIPIEFITELLTHKESHVIFCGDPFQIPPIDPTTDNHLLDTPHVFLNEVHRQSLDSDIIKLSMDIRENKILNPYFGKDAQIYNKSDLVTGMYTWADQVVCSTNKMRKQINSTVIKKLGFTKDIEEGMKIICLKNEWDILSDKLNPMVNGTIGTLSNVREVTITYPFRFKIDPYPGIRADLITDTGDKYTNLLFDKEEIVTGIPHFIDPKTRYRIYKACSDALPISANYGYAITGHKAQGSQWNKVLVIEENFPFDKEDHQKWLYTASTRSIEKLVIVKK